MSGAIRPAYHERKPMKLSKPHPAYQIDTLAFVYLREENGEISVQVRADSKAKADKFAAEIANAVNTADELAEQLEEAQSVLIAIYNNKPLPCGLLDCIDSNHTSLAAYRGKK